MKKIIVAVFTLFIASAQIAMGQDLTERRAIKEYQESVLPDIQTQINTLVGFEVPLNIDWAKIALAGDAENYSNEAYFTNVYFTPLVQALSSIASDDLGKQALSTKLKSIKVTYDADTAPSSAYENGIDFIDGSMTLNFKPFSNASDIDERSEAIVRVLESKL